MSSAKLTKTMSKSLVCWSCGYSTAEHPMPLSTYAECASCNAQLHACRMCRHWNPGLRTGCNETRAEDVSVRESANFCEWFFLNRDAFHSTNKEQEAQSAYRQLDALFENDGITTDTVSTKQHSRQELGNLFNNDPGEIDEEHPPESDRKDA